MYLFQHEEFICHSKTDDIIQKKNIVQNWILWIEVLDNVTFLRKISTMYVTFLIPWVRFLQCIILWNWVVIWVCKRHAQSPNSSTSPAFNRLNKFGEGEKTCFLIAFKFEEPITVAQYKSSQSTAAYSERLPSRHVPHPHKQDDGSPNTENTHEIQALHFRQ